MSTEPLLSCAVCGRSGFLPAGLRRHVCRKPSGPQAGASQTIPPAASVIAASPSPMSQTTTLSLTSTKPIDLEKITGDQISHTAKFDPDALGQRAVAMLAHVEALKTERAQKAILAGIYLHQVKATLGHGPFRAWTEKHFGNSCQNGSSASQRTITNHMALAAKFCRSTKLLLPELIGANQLSLALEAKDQDGQAFKAKLEKFTGGKGLTELMQQHGVIKRGGVKAPAATGAEPVTAEPPPSLSPEAASYQQFCDAVASAEAVLLDPVRWSLITPDLATRVQPLLKTLQERFTDRLHQARHEAAA